LSGSKRYDQKDLMRAWMLTIPFLIACAVPGRAAEDVAAQNVIRSQEQALSRDDSAAAYSYAGPPITSMYRSADIFMWMVRRGYAAVYRHETFEFGEARVLSDNKVTQEVHIIDTDGVPWEALYTLEQQSDGSLKIISCVLSKAVGA
jgi:hypothetical protein